MDYLNDTTLMELMMNDFGVLNQPTVRPFRDIRELREVYRLTHACYISSGYCAPHPSGMLIHYPFFDHLSQTTILVAMLHGRVVGSISLTEDGPAGFTIDEDIKEACDAVRREGQPVGAIWRLVVEESVRSGRTVVISLMNAMIDLLLQKRITTALFTINPKHERAYRRMLNARVVAQQDATHGLTNAPGVLLRFDPACLPKGSVLSSDRAFNPVHNLLAQNVY